MTRHQPRARLGRFFATAAAIVAPALVIGAIPAAASCATPVSIPAGIARADVVAVGTVTATHSRGRIAEVRVVEHWKGTVGSTLELAGGPAADNTMTTVDRIYRVGTTYLLFAFAPRLHNSTGTFGAALEDNACSNTQPWTAALAQYRPARVTPVPQQPANAPPLAPERQARSHAVALPWVPVVTAIILLAGLVLALRMRSVRHTTPN